ncbi:zinc-dependent alcohol dehydrogenase family protein [Thermodesulfovibrio thiophilus]|uniref:zinc-dependent alcohol dehydrogenase family protein n=1 Tax=Thermodesulfovibrio thiophilus TaxID=340095 RepID=UPI000429173D|nr:zinc-dependent alcohol dehydrogenase family protein [Thermodesulfovibrio thiophilus]
MKAFVIEKVSDLNDNPQLLKLIEVENPVAGIDEIVIEVRACGVCHTEIDEIEGRATPSFYPIIPGHQIVGEVVDVGKGPTKFNIGDRAGAGWIYSACGNCEFCKRGLENLCPDFKATGKDSNGGYAEYFKINTEFAFKIPENFTFEEAAPLFCAGAIGYRSLKLANPENKHNIGLVGFGASGHLVLKMIRFLYPDSKVFVFSRTERERQLALNLGAYWADDIDSIPPFKLHVAIDTTPVWKPTIEVLKHLLPAGRLVINAIRKQDSDKEELLKLDYSRDLWLEKEIKSVANITRNDIEEFLKIASQISIKPEIEIYPFKEANKALIDIKNRKIKGAKVLKIERKDE